MDCLRPEIAVSENGSRIGKWMKRLSEKILVELGGDSRRLLHGRGGHFPGLGQVAIDWFSPVVLVTLYAEESFEADLCEEVVSLAEAEPEVEAVVVQRRYLAGAPKECVFGNLPEETMALESGLRFQLSLDRNQNHGFFLDMKPGRDWVRSEARGKRVLNLFAYTCSLSVAAIAGGAESVVNLDMASGALTTGRANHRLNFDDTDCRRVSYLPHDLFKSWGKLRRAGPFDLILIDPPSMQAGSFVAEKDYAKIVRRLGELANADSQVLACLNAPHLGEDFLLEQFADFRLLEKLPQAPGFEDVDPQSALKLMLFRV